eukprot:CAMPEP_0198489394 /NCGR_PEP_ID=MMETSP1462-20131121/1445_1 /TAXON_ID=1333877 /ORGANISM="Brandtodinium nutriculum, Strain RCC3387" /LENGTH=36 /DNA_ID= /DNA_START= /DNA_END= /DNA_ORIENTATION=
MAASCAERPRAVRPPAGGGGAPPGFCRPSQKVLVAG